MKFYKTIVLTLLFFVFCSNLRSEQSSDQHTLCKASLEQHYQLARDSIINIWTILDMMRSMSIAPQARSSFAQKMIRDVVEVVKNLTSLVESCRFCAEYYRHHNREILYLEEILGYMNEAFIAVFAPVATGEEKILANLLLEISTLTTTLKQHIVS